MRESMTALITKRSLADWLRSETGVGYAAGLLQVFHERGNANQAMTAIAHRGTRIEAPGHALGLGDSGVLEEAVMTDATAFAAGWARLVDMATPYWTSPDMTHLVDQAAEDIPDDMVVHGSDLPETHGLAYLAAPLNLAGVRVDAISWAQVGSQCTLVSYAARHGKGDPIGEQIARTATAGSLPLLVPVDFAAIHYGRVLPDRMSVKFMTAWWRLIQQPLTALPRERARKSDAKADKRLKIGEHVTEVRLRSPKAKYASSHDPRWQYSHRFIVRGHWRNQPYKDGTIQKIYIASFVKGPPDKPLIIREHTYRWDR